MGAKSKVKPIAAMAVGGIMIFGCALTAGAEINYYECAEKGYITVTYNTPSGVVAVSNRGNEIYLISDGAMKALVKSPGAGKYINVSPDGRYVGYKSINEDADQAPAVLDLSTGKTRLLSDYVSQCGQVSFAADGSIAYTSGNTLHVIKGSKDISYNLGTYVNIANISPDGNYVAYTDFNGDCIVLNLSDFSKKLIDVANACQAVWSPDGSKLAVNSSAGLLSTCNLSTGEVYDLGEVNSVKWSDDSEHLVLTRSNRVNELQVSDAKVSVTDFNGANENIIVDKSECVPVSASFNGNNVMVSYSTGNLRGVETLVAMPEGVYAAPAENSSLYRAKNEEIVGFDITPGEWGATHRDIEPGSVPLLSPAKPNADEGNNIGLLDIPYIQQVWDTPMVNGSTSYGTVCCAPSSSCMLLAYYKLLPYDDKYRTKRRNFGSPYLYNYYSFFVSCRYTSPQTKYDFSLTSNGNGTPGVAGGYGHMWGNGSPFTFLADFHLKNGVEYAKNEYFEDNSERNNQIIYRECSANRPYIICLKNGTGGHVVLAFRGNQITNADATATINKVGAFICHDPYGNYNNGYNSGTYCDGRHSSYDLPGYNNGVKNIGVFYWGTTTHLKSSGIDDIVADKNSLKIEAVDGVIYIKGATDGVNAEVYGTNGMMVYSGAASEPVTGLASGIYVVKAGDTTAKVAL